MRAIAFFVFFIVLGCVPSERNNTAEIVADGIDRKTSECARSAANRYMYYLEGQSFSNAVIHYCSSVTNLAATSSSMLTNQPKGLWYKMYSELVAKKANDHYGQNIDKIAMVRGQIIQARRCVALAASNKDNVLSSVSKKYPNATNSEKINIVVNTCIDLSGLNESLDLYGAESEFFDDLTNVLRAEARENIMNFPK